MAAKGEATDLLMKFVFNGSCLPAESRTEIDLKNFDKSPLFTGFEKGKIFEVDAFTFGAGIKDQEAENKRKEGKKKEKKKDGKSRSTAGDFMRFRSGTPLGLRGYPADLNPVKITRGIDKATSRLFTHCLKCDSYDSASLVKRRGAGSPAAGEPYLRFDFHGVLVTEMDWSNEEPIKEEFSFICRIVTIHYRPQLPDGTLGASISRFWSLDANAKQPISL